MRASLEFKTEQEYQAFLRAYRGPKKMPGGGLGVAISPQGSPNPTDAAKRLLQAILDAKLPGFWCREFVFHEQRDWRLDVACPQEQIGVECDGMVHRIKKRFLGDIEKHNALILSGWRYLRVTPAQVDSGYALTLVKVILAEIGNREKNELRLKS